VTIPLPQPIPTAAGWQFMGWRRFSARTPAAAAGTGTARVALDQLGTDELWLIDRAVVTSTSTSTTSVRHYDTSADAGRLLSGTDRGNYDEAEYPGGLLMESGSQLLTVWTGVTDGAVGTVNVQVRRYQRAG
jgi:hypothetical protein